MKTIYLFVKMKSLLTLLSLLISINIFCQPLLFDRAVSFGGPGFDAGWPILTDKCGNLYTAGQFTATVDFDPSPSVYTMSSSGFGSNGYISKFDPAGNLLWSKQIVVENGILVTSLCLDSQQNICMVANATGTVDLDPGSTLFLVGSTGASHVTFSKLDPNGNFISGFSYATSLTYGYQWPLVSCDMGGNLLVCGNFTGTVDFDPGPGNFSLNSNGGSDAFVCKLSSNGTLLWARNFGGTLNETVGGLNLDNAGNLILTGVFQGSGDFDPGPGSFSLTSNGNIDIYVIKLDATGAFLWAMSFGNSSNEDYVRDLAVDTLNNIYVAGTFSGTVDFDPGPALYYLNAVGQADAFITKLDNAGNFIWARQVSGPAYDNIQSVCVDKKNKLFALGNFYTSTDVDPGSASLVFTSFGQSDLFLLKLDESGNYLDAKHFGGAANDICRKVCVNKTGSVFFTGNFSLTADFDPGPAVVNLTSNGNTDVYICKLSSCLDIPYSALCSYEICSGQSATLSAISSAAINWYPSTTASISTSTGSVLLTPTLSSSTYTYYAAASTCTNGDTRTSFIVQVNALPSLSVSVKPATVCPGQTASLSASGASTYSWSNAQQTPSISVIPTTTSIYTVIGTHTLTGCKATKTLSVVYSICAGLTKNVEIGFQLFPNPFTNTITIIMEQDAFVILYDLLGNKIFSQQIPKGSNALSTENLQEGVYLIKVILIDKSYTQKIVRVNAP